MDAVEHLPLFDNPLRALLEIEDRVSPRPVNTRQPKNLCRLAGALPQREPFLLHLDAAMRPRMAWPRLNTFIHPAAIGIAINPDGREIADPANTRRCFNRMLKPSQNRVTGFVRRNRHQHCISILQCDFNLGISQIRVEHTHTDLALREYFRLLFCTDSRENLLEMTSAMPHKALRRKSETKNHKVHESSCHSAITSGSCSNDK